jgi:hypothetical protein
MENSYSSAYNVGFYNVMMVNNKEGGMNDQGLVLCD